MMCPKCGKQNPEEAAFCQSCGARITELSPSARDASSKDLEDIESPEELEFYSTLASLTPNTFVTSAIIAINVAVFVLMVVRGSDPMSPTAESLVQWGALYGPDIAGGEWWRLLTAMFLHVGIVHILLNMWVLWNGGPLAERMVGNAGFVVLYLISGLCGSLASFYWNPIGVGAGASGAIFGVYGALMGFLMRSHGSVPTEVLSGQGKSVMAFLAYNILYGMSQQGIDMAAHFGGLAAGFVCGLIMGQPITAEAATRRVSRNVVVIVTGSAFIALVVLMMSRNSSALIQESVEKQIEQSVELDPNDDEAYRRRAALKLDKEDWDAAIADSTKAIEIDPKAVDAYGIRAIAKYSKDDWDGVIADCTKAIALDPRQTNCYAMRSYARLLKGEYDDAIDDATKTIELDPKDADAYEVRAHAKRIKGDRHGVIADLNSAIKLNSKSAWVYGTRGLIKEVNGDLKGAIADYTKLIELNPKDAESYRIRGYAYYNATSWTASLADFLKSCELDPIEKDSAHYSRLRIWLIRDRLGERDRATKELKEYLSSREIATANDWFSKVAAFLVGELSADKLLKAAKSKDKRIAREQTCEAHFYIASRLLVDGSKAKAKQHFSQCVNTGVTDFTEYSSSVVALKTLK